MNTLTTFDPQTQIDLARALANKHIQLAQRDLPTRDRSHTARNYDSAIKKLGEYMRTHDYVLPTRSALEAWRDGMVQDGYAVRPKFRAN